MMAEIQGRAVENHEKPQDIRGLLAENRTSDVQNMNKDTDNKLHRFGKLL
jgi:hypothetical protein